MAEQSEPDLAQELSRRLKDRHPDVIQAISTRAALRILPLMLPSLTASASRNLDKSVILRAFRCTFICWVALVHVRRAARRAIATVAKAASEDIMSLDLHEPFATAGFAVAEAARTASAAAAASFGPILAGRPATATTSSRAARTVVAAIQAVQTAENAGASNLVLESVNHDIDWLAVESNDEGQLIHQPLWLNNTIAGTDYKVNFPLWGRVRLDNFGDGPLVTRGPWGFWLKWYTSILSSPSGHASRGAFGENNDVEIATKRNEFWQRDADEVTADLAKIVSWYWNSLPPSVEFVESVEPQSDEPTSDDCLERRPFAQALVERMDRIYEKEGRDGFAAHIHAPWGAGKTSVLMMMRDLMAAKDRKAADGKIAREWVVVSFNAWEQERRNPPWWPLVEAVKGSCLERLSGSKGGWSFLFIFLKRWWFQGYKVDLQPALLQSQWIWWKIKTDALPYFILIIVFIIVLWLLRLGSSSQISTYYEWPLKVFAASAAAFASFLGAGRFAVFGSANNAKFYEDISQDPLQRVTRLYKKIIEKTDRPICIFIDDLDRCRADYVVDLLEGIQTSFRNKNVAYVVAADRGWIKASFEMRYEAFSSAVGSVGQPLGYLFLEKIFQVSTPVPGMGERIRTAYWNKLLEGDSNQSKIDSRQGEGGFLNSPDQFDSDVEFERENLRRVVGSNITNEQAENVLKENSTPELRAAVLLELNTSRSAEMESRHLLAQFAHIVPDNPRVMKRMVNAFAMRRAIGILERNNIPISILARWTILEQRFPALADLFIENPQWVQTWSNLSLDENREVAAPLSPYLKSDAIKSIIGSLDEDRLTSAYVRAITKGSAT